MGDLYRSEEEYNAFTVAGEFHARIVYVIQGFGHLCDLEEQKKIKVGQ